MTQEELAVLKQIFLGTVTVSAFSAATLDIWVSTMDSCFEEPMMFFLTIQHHLFVSAAIIVVGWGLVMEQMMLGKNRLRWIKCLQLFSLVWIGFGMWNVGSSWSIQCSKTSFFYFCGLLLIKMICILCL